MPEGITIRKDSSGGVCEVRYLTDDRDHAERNELVITQGGNGDWQIAVAPERRGTIGRAVRLCTSGGASSAVPGLTPLVARMFRLLARAGGAEAETETFGTRLERERALAEFQKEYERLYRWREAWTRFSNKREPGRLQTRQDAIERRARIANNRIGKLLTEFWGTREII